MDSSGSNSWMKYMPYDLDLKQIFRKAVQAGGSHKVLFGTDSTFFPRGWRLNVLEAQLTACRELEAEGVLKDEDIQRIFHDNVLELGVQPQRGRGGPAQAPRQGGRQDRRGRLGGQGPVPVIAEPRREAPRLGRPGGEGQH